MTPHVLTGPVRVAAAAHDFQFFGPLETAVRDGGGVLRKDRWWGHDRHEPGRAAELIRWADVLLAEWCLGNAVHYAAHRRDGQRLVVHFHRFELDKDFPARLDMDAVDLVVFAGPHIREAAITRFGWPTDRCVYLPNPVDVSRFSPDKSRAAGHTIGLLGWHRRLKRLDRALDLLERLRAEDDRFRLRVKGTAPQDIDWIWHDPPERRYFTEQLDRVRHDPLLRDAVTFEGYGPVPQWFHDIGFVVSASDVESFHLAAAEGMAAASVPVIIRRDGADQVFPSRWIHDGVEAAAAAVLQTAAAGDRAEQGAAARGFVRDRYDLPTICAWWRRLLLHEPG
jgi:glycosyltransferase involved in cell wall biosynthesis